MQSASTFLTFWAGFCFISLALANLYVLHHYVKKPDTAPPPPSHPCETFHDFTLINCQSGQSDFGQAITHELRCCRRCGQHLVTILPGKWTLEDLARKESELAQFDRIVR